MAAGSQNNGSQNGVGGSQTIAPDARINTARIPKSGPVEFGRTPKMNGSRIPKSHLPEFRRRPKMNAGRIPKSALKELARMPKMNGSQNGGAGSDE